MVLAVTANKLGWLAIVWAFYLSVGAVGLTLPFVLLVIGTILYLLA